MHQVDQCRIYRQNSLLIYGYEYAECPMEPAIKSFETLADQYVTLGFRNHAEVK